MYVYCLLVLYFDFQCVDVIYELYIKVLLYFINEENFLGVKFNGGLVNYVMIEFDVYCLVKDLFEFIEVDFGVLKVGDSIYLFQFKLLDGVKLVQYIMDDFVVVGIVGKGGLVEVVEDEVVV